MVSNRRPPTTVNEHHDRGTPVARFNAAVAICITKAVGSMWCAYVFATLAFIGLPAALAPAGEGVVSWIAQTFLQLVLLAVILVGTNVQAAAADRRAADTWNDAEQLIGEVKLVYEVVSRVERLLKDTYDVLGQCAPALAPALAITITDPAPRKPQRAARKTRGSEEKLT